MKKAQTKILLEIDQSKYNAALELSEEDIEPEFENFVGKNQSKRQKNRLKLSSSYHFMNHRIPFHLRSKEFFLDCLETVQSTSVLT